MCFFRPYLKGFTNHTFGLKGLFEEPLQALRAPAWQACARTRAQSPDALRSVKLNLVQINGQLTRQLQEIREAQARHEVDSTEQISKLVKKYNAAEEASTRQVNDFVMQLARLEADNERLR